jgi:DNA-binding IclR family transcriptional regulator
MSGSVDKAFDILELVAESRGGLKHAEIAKALHIPKSSVSKLLAGLVNRDYLMIDTRSKTYTIGPHVLVLANWYLTGRDIVQIAKPILQDVVIKTGESASLQVRSGKVAIIVCKEHCSQQIMVARLNIGDRLPLYATAAGKAILAFLPSEEINQFISSVELTPLTRTTITDPQILLRELRTIRARAVARCNEEQIEGLIAIAAPVFSWDGRVVASITTPFSKMRANGQKEINIENVLREAAAEISRQLGHSWNAMGL